MPCPAAFRDHSRSAGHPKRHSRVLRLAIALALLFALPLTRRAEADDCSVRTAGRDDPRWKCVPASRFKGCIPSKAFQRWRCLDVDTTATLCDDGGTFNLTAYFAHDGGSLDCNGQVIDHGYHDGDKRRPGARTPYARSVSNLALRNCTIRNTGRYGVDLKRFFRGSELSGAMTGHHNISIENLTIERPRQWGIYVGQNSRGVRIINTRIADAYGGIYLEAGSAGTVVSRATIEGSRNREGIAIDSSQRNTVEHSHFRNNPDAINIYMNCGENWGQVCPIPRSTPSDDNLLHHNRFEGGDVNIAWRQYKLYGLGFCQAVGLVGYWRDRAARNAVTDSHFRGADLEVDDGPVLIRGNVFTGGAGVELGSLRPPFYFNSPVAIAGVIADNRFDEDGGLQYDTRGVYDRLLLVDNRDSQGACQPYNRCRPEPVARRRSAASAKAIPGPDWHRDAEGRLEERPANFRKAVDRLGAVPNDRANPSQPRYRRGLRIDGDEPHDSGPCTGCR